MFQHHSAQYYAQQQRFNDRFPIAFVALLAILQMFTTFAIFALEVAHNYVNIHLTNLFVGFWTSIPFTVLWISMFAVGEFDEKNDEIVGIFHFQFVVVVDEIVRHTRHFKISFR